MRELGLTSKKDAAKKIIEASNALATRMLEILRVQGSEIRCDRKMFCVFKHGPQNRDQRPRKTLAQSWSYGENLVCL